MTWTRGIIGLAAVGLMGAAGVYAYGGLRSTPLPAQAEAPECDSCSARKKNLSRMRDAHRAPATETDHVDGGDVE